MSGSTVPGVIVFIALIVFVCGIFYGAWQLHKRHRRKRLDTELHGPHSSVKLRAAHYDDDVPRSQFHSLLTLFAADSSDSKTTFEESHRPQKIPSRAATPTMHTGGGGGHQPATQAPSMVFPHHDNSFSASPPSTDDSPSMERPRFTGAANAAWLDNNNNTNANDTTHRPFSSGSRASSRQRTRPVAGRTLSHETQPDQYGEEAVLPGSVYEDR